MDKKLETTIEETLKAQLMEAYTRGLAVGGKTFVGNVLNIIKDGRSKNINPVKILSKVKSSCEMLLGVAEQYDHKAMAEGMIESAKREHKKQMVKAVNSIKDKKKEEN